MPMISRVAVIAPIPLREAFSVVFQSAENAELIATAADIHSLQEILEGKVPDVILIYLADITTRLDKDTPDYGQVKQLKDIWPKSYCITIVKDLEVRKTVKALGADVVFIDGVSPSKLLEAIRQDEKTQSINNHTVKYPNTIS
jgi:DNA-binding NarL/FixJ family response regulator